MENKHIQQIDFSNPNADKITSGTTNKPLENKQTAIEWLIEKTTESGHLWLTDKPDDMDELSLIIEKAKEMEKEQIIDAFGVGCQVESTRLIGYHDMAEDYYNKNYKQK